MSRRARVRSVLIAALALASPALAAGPGPEAGPGPASEPSREQRETMAGIHQKMAECLRSERPFTECRNEMRSSCRTAMGATGCPMMEDGGMRGGGMGGMGHGMGGPGGRSGPPAQTPKQ